MSGAWGPRNTQLPGTELGQLEGASHQVLSKFIPVSCDGLTPSDTKQFGPKGLCTLCQQGHPFPSVLGSLLKAAVCGGSGSRQLPSAVPVWVRQGEQ